MSWYKGRREATNWESGEPCLKAESSLDCTNDWTKACWDFQYAGLIAEVLYGIFIQLKVKSCKKKKARMQRIHQKLNGHQRLINLWAEGSMSSLQNLHPADRITWLGHPSYNIIRNGMLDQVRGYLADKNYPLSWGCQRTFCTHDVWSEYDRMTVSSYSSRRSNTLTTPLAKLAMKVCKLPLLETIAVTGLSEFVSRSYWNFMCHILACTNQALSLCLRILDLDNLRVASNKNTAGRLLPVKNETTTLSQLDNLI